MSAPTHILFECATGCAVFQVTQVEEVASKVASVQAATQDISNFGRMVKLLSFSPFKSAVDALQSCLDISEGEFPVLLACWPSSCEPILIVFF